MRLGAGLEKHLANPREMEIVRAGRRGAETADLALQGYLDAL